MPESDSPPPKPDNQPTGAWAFAWRAVRLNPEEQRGFVALVLIGFVIWLVYDFVTEGRKAEAERTAMMVRAFESDGEKGRQAVSDIGKITVASHQKLSGELGKLEIRLADMNTTNQRLEQQVAGLQKQMVELAQAISDLRKKVPPSEVNFAPHPRAKPTTAAG